MASHVSDYAYLRDPAAITAESFRRIRACTDLSGFGDDGAQIAQRLVHTCGEPDLVDDLVLPEASVAAGITAISRGADILCDVRMIESGLSHRYLAGPVHCLLGDAEADARASEAGISRTMAAVDAWVPRLAGAVAVVGNAPTALFRLLELLGQGTPAPALVVGMPVGFVGAAESKAALADYAEYHGLPALILRGRRGGSALAAAAVNALARLAQGERW